MYVIAYLSIYIVKYIRTYVHMHAQKHAHTPTHTLTSSHPCVHVTAWRRGTYGIQYDCGYMDATQDDQYVKTDTDALSKIERYAGKPRQREREREGDKDK